MQSIGRRLAIAFDPRRLRFAIRHRLRELPFRLGLQTAVSGTYQAYVPDRYWVSENTGFSRKSDSIRKFSAGNRANNLGDLPRYYFFSLVFDQIRKEDIRGDYAEIGVYKGNTAALLAQIARDRGQTAYLFDTFSGFSREDFVGVDAGAAMEFSDTSLSTVRALVGEPNVRFIQGHFPGTAAQLPAELRFALVHIDCDLYAPIRASLEFFYPRMVDGGFIVMHDYSSLGWLGAERAIDEFFADKAERVTPIPDKSGTAVVRKYRRSS